ncbi:MAG TPA: hypothetical protein VKU00_32920 [Chthonomonadaceae bacterium]|nr:hypothetical protein [Chthonomonadaceae bacterium]
MPKIPLWMADVKVKFISDEARQKHPPALGLADIEPIRRSQSPLSDIDSLKDLDTAGAVIDEPDGGFDDGDAETEEIADEDY